jgi:hypothetical protein
MSEHTPGPWEEGYGVGITGPLAALAKAEGHEVPA